MQYLDEDLEITSAQKIQALEQELTVTKELLGQTINSLRETQRYLMKLAYNQSDITKKISSWPYLVVNTGRDADD